MHEPCSNPIHYSKTTAQGLYEIIMGRYITSPKNNNKSKFSQHKYCIMNEKHGQPDKALEVRSITIGTFLIHEIIREQEQKLVTYACYFKIFGKVVQKSTNS